MKFHLSRQIPKKYPNFKFHNIASIGSRDVPCGSMDGRTCGQTDGGKERHDEANSRFLQFANAPKMASSVVKLTVRVRKAF